MNRRRYMLTVSQIVARVARERDTARRGKPSHGVRPYTITKD